jgi:ADP-heptose:LPS heptosyltransferase
LISAGSRLAVTVVPVHGAPPASVIRRLIVIKPASLGDVILATPAISVLRDAFPTAHLSLAVGQWSLPAARGVLGVDEVVDLGTFGTPGRFGVRDLPEAVRVVRHGSYDLAVVLDRSPLVAVAALIAAVPWRAGIDSAGRGFAHGIRVPWVRRCHEADLYLRVASEATVTARNNEPIPPPKLAFEPGPVARAEADALWEASGLGAPGGPVVVIHPGGGANPGMTLNAKRWPAGRFGDVARSLVHFGCRVALVGDRTDSAVVAAVSESAGVPLADLSGRPDLATLAAIIGRADAYLGNDSVPVHLAVAMGTPAVALYGPTDPHAYGPYAPTDGPYAGRGIAIVSPDACSQRRTFRPGPIEACDGCRCVDLIAPSDALRAVVGLLEAGRDRLGISPR